MFNAFGQLGLGVDQMLKFEPEQMARMLCLVFEELGWGDAGLAISLGASMLPRLTAAKFGNQVLLERTPESIIGCWGATEPEHGSDVLDANRQIFNFCKKGKIPWDLTSTMSPRTNFRRRHAPLHV